jgi:hypothetical protein
MGRGVVVALVCSLALGACADGGEPGIGESRRAVTLSGRTVLLFDGLQASQLIDKQGRLQVRNDILQLLTKADALVVGQVITSPEPVFQSPRTLLFARTLKASLVLDADFTVVVQLDEQALMNLASSLALAEPPREQQPPFLTFQP